MTIREIAKLSGYSYKTVSRVINNEPNVREETRKKIQHIIKEHNYKPNLYARNLSLKRGNNLLISIRKTMTFGNSRWMDILLDKIIQQSKTKNLTVIVETYFSTEELKKSVLANSSSFIDAMIIFYEQEDDPRIKMAKDDNIPCVVFGKSINNNQYVSNANKHAVYNAFNFLYKNKLLNNCLILGDRNGTNIERADGALDFYKKNNIDINNLEILWEVNNLKDAYKVVMRKIAEKSLPEVFFVSGDEKVLAVYKSLYSNGFRIPNDVSVMGFDNIDTSEYFSPGLTTIAMDYEKLADSLLTIIESLQNNQQVNKAIEIPTNLIIRGSVKTIL